MIYGVGDLVYRVLGPDNFVTGQEKAILEMSMKQTTHVNLASNVYVGQGL